MDTSVATAATTNNGTVQSVPILNETYINIYVLSVLTYGILGSLFIAILILRQKLTGLSIILLQCIAIDTLTLSMILYPEVVVLNQEEWVFRPELCPVYLGGEIVVGTITTYLIILVNLHVITQCNYKSEETAAISVLLPSAIIWTLGASLSIPVFTLTTMARNNQCEITEQHLHITLGLIRVVFPVIIFGLTLINLLIKLIKKFDYNLILAIIFTFMFLGWEVYVILRVFGLVGGELWGVMIYYSVIGGRWMVYFLVTSFKTTEQSSECTVTISK